MTNNAVAARAEIDRLTKLRAAMVEQRKDYWIEQANIQIDVITAWIAKIEGNDDVLQLMQAAADREDKTEEHIMMPGRVIPPPRRISLIS